jgi:hypothetical protein
VGGSPAWGLSGWLTTPPPNIHCFLWNTTQSLGPDVVNTVMNVRVLALRSECERVKCCYCLLGRIVQGVLYTTTVADLLCVSIWVLISPDSSTRTLRQYPAETPSSDAGETWREMPVNFSYKYLIHTVGTFNMPKNLTTWDRCPSFPSEGCRATDFYRPLKSIVLGRV